MSLRSRLTLLYAGLTGGILLVFGMLIFGLISILLVDQTDRLLLSAAEDTLKRLRVDPEGELILLELPRSSVSTDVSILIISRGRGTKYSSGLFLDTKKPINPADDLTGQQAFYNVTIQGERLRVLNIPLQAGGHRIGELQLAHSLRQADVIRTTLLQIIILAALSSIVVAAAASWLSLKRALAPLATVTATALQIARADDLARRIPLQGIPQDEIGQLVTAFNETLERLEQIFNAQQRFLADVSHELRTPLTVIKGNVALMRKMGKLDQESLDSIEEEADRLTRLVGNLLLEAQAESGKLPLHFAPVELDTLLLEVFKEMRVLARDRVHLKITEIDQALVNGDRDRLEQVLINLISNAIKYTPDGGHVFLSLTKVSDKARLMIRDTGIGISKKDLPHIFERFYRAEKSRHRSDSGGFGLGLSISKWIITHHGGQIEVDSVEGQGTTFLIYLPLLKEGEVEAD